VHHPMPLNPDGVGILTAGVVSVTLEQAEAAAEFGWKKLPLTQVDGLVQIERGTAGLKN